MIQIEFTYNYLGKSARALPIMPGRIAYLQTVGLIGLQPVLEKFRLKNVFVHLHEPQNKPHETQKSSPYS